MTRHLVIACGNPLRGDDGVGWRIAEALKNHKINGDWIVESVHQLTPELAEAISQAETVIFVDASESAQEGVVEVVPVPQTDESSAALSHTSTPGGLVRLARDLYGKAPARAYVVTVGACRFEYSEELSRTAAAAVHKAVAAIQEIVAAK